jgi:hypothetical protein
MCNQKIETFLHLNQFVKINKYPTYVSCKQKQQAIQKYKTLVDKPKATYVTQINTSPPVVQTQIKIQKENAPVRPFVNNVYAPAYKISKINT